MFSGEYETVIAARLRSQSPGRSRRMVREALDYLVHFPAGLIADVAPVVYHQRDSGKREPRLPGYVFDGRSFLERHAFC